MVPILRFFPLSNTVTVRRVRRAGVSLLALGLLGCAGGATTPSAGQPASEAELIAGMQVVDCLLPGQLRSLGSGTYLTPRRPIKTTAADCNIRGGEYVAYDRADYKTALRVWMPAAEAGDAEAQVNVGEIFEKGLGTEPNYEAAVIWYRKAAEQGNARGLFNLGTLYEQGLGVEQDKVQALNLYRQAWGLPEDSVIFQETARREQEALRSELTGQLRAKDAQVQLLQKQIDAMKQQLLQSTNAAGAQSEAAIARNRELQTQIDTLNQLVASLRTSANAVQQKLTDMPKLRAPTKSLALSRPQRADEPTRIEGVDFGAYYALVIGNSNYAALDKLDTPLNDARGMARVLEEQYGFQVQLLLDADRLTIMKAINELHDILGENDNLLLYYAGHGSLVDVGEHDTGYWLPINADPPPNDSFWVPNEFITNHLGRIKAKRVLVVADSCYGGLLSSSPGHLFLGNNTASGDMEYIRYKLPRRARLLLSSGGNEPVIDNGGDGHSVFARELIEALRSNKTILSAPNLFISIKDRVEERALAMDFKEKPVYKSIKGAGHEVGDFFFVPVALAQ